MYNPNYNVPLVNLGLNMGDYFDQLNTTMSKYRGMWLHSWAVWQQTNALVMQKYLEATTSFLNAISTQQNFMCQSMLQMMGKQ